MATLVLGLAGMAAGGAGLVGIGTLTWGGLLGAVGGFAGSIIDRMAINMLTPPTQVQGPRLSSLKVTASTEGAPVMQVLGRQRIGGEMIWATNFREASTTDTQGGKGLGGPKVETTTYTYYCSFAIGLCEGPIVGIDRVWADGKLLDLSKYTYRLYTGGETQDPDPKIEAVEGTGNVPAYRGLAYIVFEEMLLTDFGNRIPQITVEVIRRPPASAGEIEDAAKAVVVIPGLGEFVYATDVVYQSDGFGTALVANQHAAGGQANLPLALDQLQSLAGNVAAASLVVSWLGSDLRCGDCTIKPKVEHADKTTTPWPWQVGPVTRDLADVVSSDGGGPLLGGTPADRAVYQAIVDMKARGLRVVVCPFINMDIASGNSLPDPYSNGAAAAGQPAFPWRGRITCSPAAGYTGTVDKTATAATQVAAFFGSCAAGDFGWDATNLVVTYTGPDEWGFRRLILHYATLAKAAGADAILIGSEMVGLTTVRSAASTFPAVTALATLAAEVRTIVGSGIKIGYAADWTEYANYRPADGSNDVYFHLDPLWSDSHVDFIGIDNYLPLSDWRDGASHLDALAGAPSIYDQTYLQGNVEGGELYDWYYASSADRDSQTRTNVTDGVYGEPWVFRYKDIKNWWLNAHHNRPAGVRDVAATAWTAQSKPVWFTELGCPAVDKGSNQPNVFYDPKSSESAYPYYSTGQRDDLIQRAHLQAVLDYWAVSAGHNPTSSVYGAPMIDMASVFLYAWDARPYPQFPYNSDTWRDAANWQLGHWISGRFDLVTLAAAVTDLCQSLAPIDVSRINGVVAGYTIDNLMSPRSALGPLMQLFFFDAAESGAEIKFVPRGRPAVAPYTMDGLVDSGSDANAFYQLTRAQETDLPHTVHLQFADPANDYQPGDVYARRLRGSSDQVAQISPPIVLDYGRAHGIADALLIDAWVAREAGTAVLPPSAYAIEPADVVTLTLNGRSFTMRLDEIGYQHSRPAKLTRTDAATYQLVDGPASPRQPAPVSVPGPAVLEIMDLPILSPDEVAGVPRLAAFAAPWAKVNVYQSPTSSGYALDRTVISPSIIGKTLADFYSGPLWRWDNVSALYVQVPPAQTLSSLADELVLAGGNTCAVKNADGQWEILQFATATLTAPSQYKLTRLLRGQLGSEYAMRDAVATGATFVLLSPAALQSGVSVALRNLSINWKYGPATRPIDDASYQTEAFTFAGIGLQPYAPVHLAAAWDSLGNIQMSWLRRTRIDGDPWEPPDVPLGEEAELYDVEIMDALGTTVVRTITGLGAPAYRYDSAVQTTDFGAPLTSIEFRVYQVSASYGRGAVASYG